MPSSAIIALYSLGKYGVRNMTNMNHKKAKDAFEKAFDYVLKDFHSDDEELSKDRYESWGIWANIDLDESVSPLPYMVFICLVVINKFGYWGKGEKVLWEIPIRYKSYSFLLAHWKFGFSLKYKGDKPPDSIVKEMLKLLDKAIKKTDRLLQPFANKQVETGNVTIANRYIRLDMRYQFFRKKAKESYSRIDKKQRIIKKGTDLHPFSNMLKHVANARQEGAYYSIAMLDSYFSKLEHLLVLILPFMEFNRTEDNLASLMSATWSVKYKRIFNLSNNQKAKNLFDRLTSVKEKYRNTSTHGDFEKGGVSLFFHLPKIAAIPVRMSSFKDSIYYSFLPITLDSYQQICDLLDEVDDFLKTGTTKYGVTFAEAGLDVAFDKNALTVYSEAMKSDDKFESLIEGIAYQNMIFDNMDF